MISETQAKWYADEFVGIFSKFNTVLFVPVYVLRAIWQWAFDYALGVVTVPFSEVVDVCGCEASFFATS
ncbi:MAG: hypothetical protein ACTSO7_13945 [Candidatus Heimdallarchaeota archaeon]